MFGFTIFVGAVLFWCTILWIDGKQVNGLKEQRKHESVNSSSWRIEYSEASEDRRQYTNLTWQLPSAILVADSIAISFAFSNTVINAPVWAQTGLLLAAFLFNVIMYVNFWKFAFRSYSRLLRLQRIEEKHEMKRIGEEEPIPAKLGTWKIMNLLIILLSAGLLDVAIPGLWKLALILGL